MVKCKYCNREFHNEFAYYAHKCEGYVKERTELKKQKEKENEEGIYICNGCGKHYKNKNSIRSHARFCENYKSIRYDDNGNYISKSKYKISENLYKCECGKEFNNSQSLNAHLSYCEKHHEICGTTRKLRPHEITKTMSGWENKSEEEKKEIYLKAGKTHSENLKSGKTINHWVGKEHTPETKEKMRNSLINYRNKNIINNRANYSITGCEYIDKLNEQKGWHLQHALNGGEVIIAGYYVDGYDKENNIVFEYDEPRHYEDVYNNILKDKDIERQNYIIQKLHCKFYRYNERLNLLYEVTNI